MKPKMSHVPHVLSSFKDKLNIFYFLAFTPLLLILYYNAWVLIIALYGFIFLLLKNQKLQSARNAKLLQRVPGLIIIIGSFFIYYALVLVIPTASFYGGANYVVFLLGLFLVFFDLPALKEAFTPLFFIASANSSTLVAAWLKPYFSPYLGDIAYIVVNILRVLGVNVLLSYSSSPPSLSFRSLPGPLVLASFAYECLGVSSALIFSIVIVVVLFEDPGGWKVKLLASVIGVLVTFGLNIFRVTIILLVDYFYGAEAGATVHYIIGYALFSVWLGFFLYVYSKRETIQKNIQTLWRKPDLLHSLTL